MVVCTIILSKFINVLLIFIVFLIEVCYNYIRASGDIMSKVKIKSYLHNKTLNEVYTNDVIGIKNHDKIIYKENIEINYN